MGSKIVYNPFTQKLDFTEDTAVAIGDEVTSGTTGSVLFVGSGGTIAQDNSNLFWDDTNDRLGIGTNSPTGDIEISNANTSSDLSVVAGTHTIIENTDNAAGQSKFLFTFAGTPKGGIRGDYNGNFSWHATGSQGHQFYNSLDITKPIMGLSQNGVVVGGVAGDTVKSGFRMELIATTSVTPLLVRNGRGNIEFYKDDTPTKAQSVGLGYASNSADEDLIIASYNGTAWAETARFTNDNYFGLNETAPSAMFDTVIDATTDIGWELNAAASQSADLVNITSNGGSAGDLVTVDKDGNVGIGTNSPTNALLDLGNQTTNDRLLYMRRQANLSSSDPIVEIIDDSTGTNTIHDYSVLISRDEVNLASKFALGVIGAGRSGGIKSSVDGEFSAGPYLNQFTGNLTSNMSNGITILNIDGTNSDDNNANNFVALGITPTINQSGTASGNYTALKVNVTETSVLGTDNRLLDLQTDSSSHMVVTAAGNVGIGTTAPSQALSMGDDKLIARDVNAGLTASVTQTQGQGALTAEVNEVSTCANANDTVTLPTATTGLKIVIINNGANTLKIFPASGDNLGAGVDTATTLASGATVVYCSYDATNWVSI